MLWAHPLDVGVAALLRSQRMFTSGWGDAALLSRLEGQLLFDQPPAVLDVDWLSDREKVVRYGKRTGTMQVRNGIFTSPLTDLPPAVVRAHVRLLSVPGNRRVVIVLAGSREEGFGLREAIYGRLVFRGIDVVLLENPFYGLRRPAEQRGASVRTVSEHVLLNMAMVEEGRGLVGWLDARGYERIAAAGYSMGGFMAGLVAATSPKPIAVAAFAAGASPSPTFTTHFLSWSVDYKALGDEGRERMARVFERANLTRFAPPLATHAAVIIGCTRDGYVPATETRALHEHWQGSELRWVNSGHIAALFTERRALRRGVRDALERLVPVLAC